MIIRFIGDVHAKFNEYVEIASHAPEGKSIQVGDFGMGFREPMFPEEGDHRFIRGNHDSPNKCRQHAHWIPDGHIDNGMLFIGGALSVDQHYRTEGVSWWRDEELSYMEMQDILESVDYYICAERDIKTVASHTCPHSAIAPLGLLNHDKFSKTATTSFLDAVWEIVQPKSWVFGHWHQSVHKEIDGCTFLCLNELEFVDIDFQPEA